MSDDTRLDQPNFDLSDEKLDSYLRWLSTTDSAESVVRLGMPREQPRGGPLLRAMAREAIAAARPKHHMQFTISEEQRQQLEREAGRTILRSGDLIFGRWLIWTEDEPIEPGAGEWVDMRQQPGRRTTSRNAADMNIHILRAGQAMCGFDTRPPSEWAAGHVFVTPENAPMANCAGCQRRHVKQHGA